MAFFFSPTPSVRPFPQEVRYATPTPFSVPPMLCGIPLPFERPPNTISRLQFFFRVPLVLFSVLDAYLPPYLFAFREETLLGQRTPPSSVRRARSAHAARLILVSPVHGGFFLEIDSCRACQFPFRQLMFYRSFFFFFAGCVDRVRCRSSPPHSPPRFPPWIFKSTVSQMTV